MRVRILAAVAVFFLSATASLAAPRASSIWSVSWYGSDGMHGYKSDRFVGKPMAMPGSGKLNPNRFTAANPWLKFGTRVLLTYPKTGRSACVTITDRGPAKWTGHALDVTFAVAEHLGFTARGVADLEVKIGC